MLTREDMKNINNRLKGTGKYMDKPMFDTLKNSANGFLIADAPVALVEEVQAQQYEIKIEVQEEPVVRVEQQQEELTVPYFVTPFYMECKVIAEATGKTVDEVAYEKLARQLGVTTRKAIKLVQEGRIIVRY